MEAPMVAAAAADIQRYNWIVIVGKVVICNSRCFHFFSKENVAENVSWTHFAFMIQLGCSSDICAANLNLKKKT